jgi:hypothetical protein
MLMQYIIGSCDWHQENYGWTYAPDRGMFTFGLDTTLSIANPTRRIGGDVHRVYIGNYSYAIDVHTCEVEENQYWMSKKTPELETLMHFWRAKLVMKYLKRKCQEGDLNGFTNLDF